MAQNVPLQPLPNTAGGLGDTLSPLEGPRQSPGADKASQAHEILHFIVHENPHFSFVLQYKNTGQSN